MSLACVSISFKNCSVSVRERLHLDGDKLTEAYRKFNARSDSLRVIDGLVILSTCNRTELYYHLADSQPDAEALAAALGRILFGADVFQDENLTEQFDSCAGTNVVRHLCRVASGLESVVVGEPQILGQVSEALKLSVSNQSRLG